MQTNADEGWRLASQELTPNITTTMTKHLPVQCKICHLYFSYTGFIEHPKQPHVRCSICDGWHHTVIKCYPCSQCGLGFRNPSGMTKHFYHVKHDKCLKCGKGYVSSKLANHAINCPKGVHEEQLALQSSSVVTDNQLDELGDADAAGEALQSSAASTYNSVRAGDEFVRDVETRASQYLQECRQMVEEECERAPNGTRAKGDFHEYQKILEITSPGTPISAKEYHSSTRAGASDAFVVCSAGEARSILEKGPPLLPILIPAKQNLPDSNRRVPNNAMLDYMRALPTVDLQVLHRKGKDKALPMRPNSEEATKRLCNPQEFGPSNALNLRSRNENPIPSSLAGLANYNLLTTTVVDNGKPETHDRTDWEASSEGGLFASKGAVSLFHIDRGGVITTVFCNEGKKLWVVKSCKQLELLGDFAETQELSFTAFPIPLEAGDTLIQPQGTLHAPFSLSQVGMSFTMHLHTFQVLGALRLALLELRFPHLTNEDPSPDFIRLMKQVLKLWEARNPPWTWGSEEELDTARKALEVGP